MSSLRSRRRARVAQPQTVRRHGCTLTGAQKLAESERQGLFLDFTDRSILVRDGTTAANRANSFGLTDGNGVLRGPTALLTYTSPSVKMCMGPSGTLRYGAHNLCLRSSTFSTTWAMQISATRTSQASEVDPFGATGTVWEIDTSPAPLGRIQQDITWVSGATYSYELWVKAPAASAATAVRITTNDGASWSTGGTTKVTLTTSWQKVTLTGTLTGTTLRVMAGRVNAANGDDTDCAGKILIAAAHVRRTPSDRTYLATGASSRFGLPYEWSSAGVLQGMLVEEARTNLAVVSNTFSNATYWNTANHTIVANAVGPDGVTNSAWTVTTTAAAFNQTYQAVTLTTAAHTWDIYVKRGTANFLWMDANDGSNRISYFNLATGATATNAAGNTSTMTALPDGWYRCTVTRTAAGTSGNIAFGLCDSDGGFASASLGITAYVYNGEIQLGAFATSPIVTPGASTVTRAADNITLATSAYPKSWPCTFFAEVGTLLDTGDGGLLQEFSTGFVSLARNGAAQLNGFANGTAQFSNTVSSPTFLANTTSKAAARFNTNDSRLCLDGTLGTQDTSVDVPSASRDTCYIGLDAGSGTFINGYIRKLMNVPRAYSDAELQTLTTP
jgi:hypothetical protein